MTEHDFGFVGEVSDIKVYDHALTYEEVMAIANGEQVTPEKRNYLLKVFVVALTALMIVGGYLSQDAWLPVVMGT